jgi:glycosyltransferase involved in cell wall biosynthesis
MPQVKKTADEDVVKILCVANWRLPKRLDLIVESLSGFAAKSGRPVVLKVAGKGSQIEIMKKKNLPVNLKIEWLGYIDKRTIAEILQKTDYFLHASDTETFSIVTAEALATGTPVIVSNTGALPELVNRSNGLLAENNTGSWIRALVEITALKLDREAIASQNRERFSAEKIGQSIINQYDIASGFHL